jgi:CheY-like chemotaxis protein
MATILNWNQLPPVSILIAEDDDANLFYLHTLLKKADMQVIIAGNGKEAVEFCKSHPEIRIVLMDIRMPEMDGIEATRVIKSFRKELPIIAVTAYAMNGDESKARAAGCDDYLTKPLNRMILFDKIRQFIN